MSSSTAFKLKRKEASDDGIRRAAHGRTTDAIGLLRDEDADEVEAVHEARKDMKKLRATLKLVRPMIDKKTYRRENGRFRDAGRELSDARDAQVRLQTVDALAERFADDPPPGGWWAVRAELANEGPSNGNLEGLRERAAAQIEAGDAAIDGWPLGEDGFDLLRPGLRQAYARARKRLREARSKPTDGRLHEFRKRSKDLWYQLRLVRRGWPAVLKATADEAHELSDRLGDDHDFAVLDAELRGDGGGLVADQVEHLRRLIEIRRDELQDDAFALGERLLAEKPKRFVNRLERYWTASPL